MTDPVDTDALRGVTRNEGLWEAEALLITAAADEVDRLRDALVEARAASDGYSQALSEHHEQGILNEGRLQQERDRLRAVIENAPHDTVVCTFWWSRNTVEPMPCTCWKADAL